MRSSRALTGRLALVLALGALTGCGDEPAPDAASDPERMARQLFELARQPDPARDTLALLFGEIDDENELAALYDALTLLRPAAEVEVVGVEPLDGLSRTVVDLAATLPGGGAGAYSVQLSRGAEGDLTVSWFQGPGVEWPARRRPRGPGLSSRPQL